MKYLVNLSINHNKKSTNKFLQEELNDQWIFRKTEANSEQEAMNNIKDELESKGKSVNYFLSCEVI